MRKSNLLFVVLSLFLLVPASITRAQTITSQKGLTTASFSTQYGTVKVYLPDDIRTGDIISGTVISEPDGKNGKQIEKNIQYLSKFNVRIDGNKFPVSEKPASFKWLVDQQSQLSLPIELLNRSGYTIHELRYEMKPSGKESSANSSGCFIPSHLLDGSSIRILGSFDGDASNTKCSLGNKSLEILAESPRQICTPVSLDLADPGSNRTMFILENGKPLCSGTVSMVNMNVSAGKLSLQKGESTYLDVSISGLQNLPDTSILTLNNLTESIVSLLPANNIIIPLAPDNNSTGMFNKRFEIHSHRAGSFSVDVNLDLPDIVRDQLLFNNVDQLEDSIKKRKDELEKKKRERDITIDDDIKKAEKEKRDCDKELEEAKKKAADANEALEKAKQKKENIEKNIGPGKTFPDKDAAKKHFGDYEKEYEDAKNALDVANINLEGLKKKCPELTKALEKLKNRKTVALPEEIKKDENEIKELEQELEREKTKAEEEKKRLEDEQRKTEEEKRQKTQAEKDAEDAKYKTKAENIYLLQNIYSLGLISSKIWEIPGLMDWLPDILEKPVGDAAEDLVKTPIPLDAISAIAGLYSVVGAKLDPCTAEGSITTIRRLRGMINSKTKIAYTEEEALDKTERMCELLKKLKAIAAAAKK